MTMAKSFTIVTFVFQQPQQQVISQQQIGSQLPQGLTWTTPHFLTAGGQNQIFIRGTQPDQMFLQPQQSSMQNNVSVNSHQHFSMRKFNYHS